MRLNNYYCFQVYARVYFTAPFCVSAVFSESLNSFGLTFCLKRFSSPHLQVMKGHWSTSAGGSAPSYLHESAPPLLSASKYDLAVQGPDNVVPVARVQTNRRCFLAARTTGTSPFLLKDNHHFSLLSVIILYRMYVFIFSPAWEREKCSVSIRN